MKTNVTLVLCLAPWLLAHPAAGSVVSNGGFEIPAGIQPYQVFNTNTPPPGWVVESGTVEIVGGFWQAAEGVQSLDLNGTLNDVGTIYQDVLTTPGERYRIRFAVAGNPDCGPTVKTTRVFWDGVELTTTVFSTAGHSVTNMGWTYHEQVVTAAASTSRLKFQSLTPGSCGPALDDVSVTPLDVPSPSIRITNRTVTVSWPMTADGWELEQSSHLNPPIPWTLVPAVQYRVNGAELSVVVTTPSSNMYYRLRAPSPTIPLPPIPDLTGHWRFDDGPAQWVADASGEGNTLVLTNVNWTNAGRIGSGAGRFLNGSAAWVNNAGYRVLPPNGGPFSVTLWISPDTLTPGWQGLVGNDQAGTSGWQLALHSVGPGTNEFVLSTTGTGASLSVTGRAVLLPGQWYELAVTYDGSSTSGLYLNGERLASGTGALLGNADPIFIGGGIGGYASFAGRLDDLRTYTNSLSQEAISLKGCWRFDENAGTVARDSSGQGNDGALSSSTAWGTGHSGYGINLSNAQAVVAHAPSAVLPPTGGPFSLSLWMYPRCLTTNWQGLLSCGGGTNNGWAVAVSADSQGQARLRFWSTDSGGTLDLRTAAALADETWSKLDLTFNGGIATMYVNGRKVNSASGGIRGNAGALVLGVAPGAGNFDGVVDDLKFYNRERGEAEIGPVAKVMWETAFINTTTNIELQGSGPAGRPLSYFVNTNGLTHGALSPGPAPNIFTYVAGPNKGPEIFTYTVSDGEFTSPPTVVTLSVVQPHWLSTNGGSTPPLDGSTPEKAWVGGTRDALEAIWRTNAYYDCFFYGPGVYETRGWKYGVRGTASPGCKHIGTGIEEPDATTLRLVEALDPWGEGVIFVNSVSPRYADSFEVHQMVLDCNANNNPMFTRGEPVAIVIPLATNLWVTNITLHWRDDRPPWLGAGWYFGPAQEFTVCVRVLEAGGYVTNCLPFAVTGSVHTVPVESNTDQIVIRLDRRAEGVDFYHLAEVEVTAAAAPRTAVSLPVATVIPAGGECISNSASADYSTLQAVDGDDSTVWTTGLDQVQIVLPLYSNTAVSQITFKWNCKKVNEIWLGPASSFQVLVRNPTNHQCEDVPFVRLPRSPTGLETIVFVTTQRTDALFIRLTEREWAVNRYSLRELVLQNGTASVALKIPTAAKTYSSAKSILYAFDTDQATAWASSTQGMIGAVGVSGNNLKFTRLKVIGFGTKATRECFPFRVETPLPHQGPYQFGNVLVTDCVFTEPVGYNPDGVTVVTVFGYPPHLMTNAIVRNCTVTDMRSHFGYSHAFSSVHVENCRVTDCRNGVYFEPDASTDDVGPVLIRSNQFLNVNNGVQIAFHGSAQFDAITCLENEIVLSDARGYGFVAYDNCDTRGGSSITNVTFLDNIVRYADWATRPATTDGGIHYSDIQNAVFGNNLIVLGGLRDLRVRQCNTPPAAPSPAPMEPDCNSGGGPTPCVLRCLNVLPPDYHRAWFNNRNLGGTLLPVRINIDGLETLAAEPQWP